MSILELLVALAVVPACLLLSYVKRKDNLDTEPVSLLRRLGIFGAIAVLPAGILELLSEGAVYYVSSNISSPLGIFLENFLFVGLIEEGAKLIMLRRQSWNRPEFNCSYDGLLYSVYVSLGFALLENVIYVFTGGLATALIRAFTSIPGHAFFGVLMGTQYAAAKRAQFAGDEAGRKKHMRLALVYAAAVHGLYDLLLGIGTVLSVILFFALVIAIYIIGIKLIKRASENDMYLETGSTIPPDQEELDPNFSRDEERGKYKRDTKM